jgi:RNA polymerase II subunit A small phosphatase-like protein
MNTPSMERRLIIFDLDETLVHATEKRLTYPCDFEVPPYFVYCRPFANNLLQYAAARFDLAVWSSSSCEYVDLVVERLFSGIPLKFAWSVERCIQRVDTQTNGYVYIKDLRKVQGQGYTTDRITIIDDSPEKIARQPHCHLRVAPFVGDRSDTALLAIQETLHGL